MSKCRRSLALFRPLYLCGHSGCRWTVCEGPAQPTVRPWHGPHGELGSQRRYMRQPCADFPLSSMVDFWRFVRRIKSKGSRESRKGAITQRRGSTECPASIEQRYILRSPGKRLPKGVDRWTLVFWCGWHRPLLTLSSRNRECGTGLASQLLMSFRGSRCTTLV